MRETPEARRARRRAGRLANAAEDAFAQAAKRRGWYLGKRGWPDFWCVGPTGEFIVVEVKPDAGHPLKREQKIVLQLLADHGIKVYRWDPEAGFRRVHPTRGRK